MDPEPISNPYEDLFIYYLQGRLNSSGVTFNGNYIGNWEEGDFSFLFFTRPAPDEIENLLKEERQLTLLDSFHMTYDQWQGGRLSPVTIGRFTVAPPWVANPAPSEALQILLDPGVVFGTGTHPTTRDCIEALEQVAATEKLGTVLDLGTGTGLLALAAAKLGCRRCLAADLNFLAAQTARRNVVQNRMENRILVVQGHAERLVDYPADLVMANIHHAVMMQLIKSEYFREKKWYILSGLLRSQAKEVAETLAQYGIVIEKKWERDGIWHTFLASARPH